MERKQFIQQAATLGAGALLLRPFSVLAKKAANSDIIGHGHFKYRVNKEWGNLNPSDYPVNDCHEMVMDSQKRLFMLTNEPKNNMLIYDKSGKLLDSWTLKLTGAHGLTLHNENGTEYLYITDYDLGEVYKTTLEGKILLTIRHPKYVGAYSDCDKFKPTETCIGPNGDIYIADGYGSQYVLQYTAKGEFIRKFGGESMVKEDKFKQVHGIALDTRDKANPTLICTERMKNCFKRFTLDGQYLSSIYLPGAYMSRPVFDGEMLYTGVCWSALVHHYLTPNSGFVAILDGNNRVVSNPGGTYPRYVHNELQEMVQAAPIFKHCHDVCVDDDKNLYIPQWNAGKVYPYKLERV
ncbi:6-bladed beta-propeller [Parasediminibacterium sp. JCM 36343]|uniref:6-bladed beta-propeller n=1 Tax=Parasediminibacterium sp. JCM 36343 TaxID=3374279 RepID=UPI00397B63A5